MTRLSPAEEMTALLDTALGDLSGWTFTRLHDGSVDTGRIDLDGGVHAEIWWVNCANGYAWLVSLNGTIVAQVDDYAPYPRFALEAVGRAASAIRERAK